MRIDAPVVRGDLGIDTRALAPANRARKPAPQDTGDSVRFSGRHPSSRSGLLKGLRILSLVAAMGLPALIPSNARTVSEGGQPADPLAGLPVASRQGDGDALSLASVLVPRPMQDGKADKAVTKPNLPKLDYSEFGAEIEKLEARKKKAQEAAAENNNHANRTQQNANNYAYSRDPLDRHWYDMYTKQAKSYRDKSAALSQEVTGIDGKVSGLKTTRSTQQEAARKELHEKWGTWRTWLEANRLSPQDKRLTNQYPANMKILAAASQDHYSWMTWDGAYYIRDLVENAKNQPSLEAAHKQITGYTPVTEKYVGAQMPLASSNETGGWKKADSETLGRYRRVLMIVGEQNPGDSNWDEESFMADTVKMRQLLVRHYGVPDNPDNFVVLYKPNEAQLRKAFADMEAFADRALADAAKRGLKNVKPEALVLIGGHGTTLGLEPGLPKEAAHLEGSQVLGVQIRTPKGKDKGFMMTDTLLKELSGKHLGQKFGSVLGILESCQSGAGIARRPLIAAVEKTVPV